MGIWSMVLDGVEIGGRGEKMAEGRNRSAMSVQANVQHCSANIAQ